MTEKKMVQVTVGELRRLVQEGCGKKVSSEGCGGGDEDLKDKKGKELLADEVQDPLEDVRTVNQLVMGIRTKLQKITDPRALKVIASVVDAVADNLPTLKYRQGTSFSGGVKKALDAVRAGGIGGGGVGKSPLK